jgi:hypothetical protein
MTLADWREKYSELEERMAEAKEKARQKMLQRIKRAAENDWRAAAEWLRLTFPADYRRASNTSVEVNTAVQTQAVVCDEAMRAKLVAQPLVVFVFLFCWLLNCNYYYVRIGCSACMIAGKAAPSQRIICLNFVLISPVCNCAISVARGVKEQLNRVERYSIVS